MMLELYTFGYHDFDLNLAACLHAVKEEDSKVSEVETFDVVGILSDPEFLKKYRLLKIKGDIIKSGSSLDKS
jgi:hypothetical protein